MAAEKRGYSFGGLLWVLLPAVGSVQFFQVSWARMGRSCLVRDDSEMPSTVKGQIGSRMMNERRKEKPVFAEERATVMALAQPAVQIFN